MPRARELAVERDLARRVAGALAQCETVALERAAVELDRALVRSHEAVEDAQERRLAAAVRPEQADHATGPGVEVDARERRLRAEAPHDTARAQRSGRGGGSVQGVRSAVRAAE